MDSGLTFDWDGVSIEEDLVNIELTFPYFIPGFTSKFFVGKNCYYSSCNYKNYDC